MDALARRALPLVVIGGSAGSIEPLRTILAGLPPEFPAAVCIVVHMPEAPSGLPIVLGRVGPLDAEFAEDGTPLVAGRIRVAPPGRHLLVNDGRLKTSRGARENRSRPAIDPLFRTAAASHGSGVVSVLLSGALDDGVAGTVAVHRRGGRTIVQDPAEALFKDMPRNAIATRRVDEVLHAADIAARITELVGSASGASGRRPVPAESDLPAESDRNGQLDPVERGIEGPATDLEGVPSAYSCPDCGGVLYERGRPGEQFLCRVGHLYSPQALDLAQESVVEDALWIALRALEEQASLALRIRDRCRLRGDDVMALRFEDRHASARDRADRIRVVLRLAKPPDDEELLRAERLESEIGGRTHPTPGADDLPAQSSRSLAGDAEIERDATSS